MGNEDGDGNDNDNLTITKSPVLSEFN